MLNKYKTNNGSIGDRITENEDAQDYMTYNNNLTSDPPIVNDKSNKIILKKLCTELTEVIHKICNETSDNLTMEQAFAVLLQMGYFFKLPDNI
jgi:hypothetical protein